MEDQVLGHETVDLKRAFKRDKTGIKELHVVTISTTLYNVEAI